MTDTFQLCKRFRGYFPVVVDLETAGFNAASDALLEIAAVTLSMDAQGFLSIDQVYDFAIKPFPNATLNPSSLAFIGIDPHDPERDAIDERAALHELFKQIRKQQKAANCHRSILVGHNPAFDIGFLNAAIGRTSLKRSPFHPFATFDTGTASGICYGQTVLQKACHAAGIDFDDQHAHSARYDALKTAELFCTIVNRWQTLAGWPEAANGHE